jgi:HAMP domain-containing protein
MKWNSIRTKIAGALGIAFLAGVVVLLVAFGRLFNEEANALAQDAVRGAQRQFAILENRQISKLTTLSSAVIANAQIREALAAKDRKRLLEITTPLFEELKKEGVTNWLFHEPEDHGVVFLRLHNPGKFGDRLNRFMYDQAVRTHQIVTGKELAKAGFAVRIMRPVFGASNQVIGYLELGEELGRFLRDMKTQSGDDYGLVLKKDLLDRNAWAETASLFKRRDNWDDDPSVVVIDKTTTGDQILSFAGVVASLPDEGMAIERIQKGGRTFVRGIFPVTDAANRKVGGMFVLRDITANYARLGYIRNVLTAVIIGAMAVCSLVLMLMLSRMVFRRLDNIVRVATRVVGGDFETRIEASSTDEIGQFEKLFEQFREVFVNLLHEVQALHPR